MKRESLSRLALFGALMVGLSSAQAEGDADAGKAKAITCLGCHAIAGYYNVYPTYRVPRVGGQHAEYLIAALKAYKNGDRKHPTMEAQAASLSDEDMADIAAYFAGNGQ